MKGLKSRAREALHPLKQWAQRCHEASLALVQAGVADRVARGFGKYVGLNHSWAVVGFDCYDKKAVIIDPTLWSYTGKAPSIWIGTLEDGMHKPPGMGDILHWGRPEHQGGKTVALTPKKKLSEDALFIIEMIGPLDRKGWATLANHAPVQGWAAGEIFAAMDDTEDLRALVPIDKMGMLTDRNPGGLYLRKEKKRGSKTTKARAAGA